MEASLEKLNDGEEGLETVLGTWHDQDTAVLMTATLASIGTAQDWGSKYSVLDGEGAHGPYLKSPKGTKGS